MLVAQLGKSARERTAGLVADTSAESIDGKLRRVFHSERHRTEALRREEFLINNSPGADESFKQISRYIAAAIDDHVVGERLAAVCDRFPVLLVWGREDVGFPALRVWGRGWGCEGARLGVGDPPVFGVVVGAECWRIPVECDPRRVCEVLVGLGDVEVLGVEDAGAVLGVHVRLRVPRPCCGGCGGVVWSDGERLVRLVDLPVFGRPVRLVWHKRRWRCPDAACSAGTVVEQSGLIAPPRARLSTRCGRWVTQQAGRGRPLSELAGELGCSWHSVNASVQRWGRALLEADTARVGAVRALGLDETLMWRRGRFKAKAWATSIVDVGSGQLLDMVPGRTAAAAAGWMLRQPPRWRGGVRWAVLDLSGPYRAAFNDALPQAGQVADPFHVVRLANDALDEVRRRVQHQTLGHRGRKHDPLWRARKLLVTAHERLDPPSDARLRGLLAAGDPHGEVRDAWHAKETLRSIYDITDFATGAETVEQLAQDLQHPGCPPEINRLGRTIWKWRTQITNYHKAHVTNAPTEAANNLIKRTAFGFTNFNNYRIRSLLYAGKPNWNLLHTITPPQKREEPDSRCRWRTRPKGCWTGRAWRAWTARPTRPTTSGPTPSTPS